jgi:hypothetical protein
MTRLIARRTRLVFETPLRIGKRPLIVAVEAWGLRLREKGRRHDLTITWAQIWNRAAIIAADARRTERAVTRTRRKFDERNNSS